MNNYNNNVPDSHTNYLGLKLGISCIIPTVFSFNFVSQKYPMKGISIPILYYMLLSTDVANLLSFIKTSQLITVRFLETCYNGLFYNN